MRRIIANFFLSIICFVTGVSAVFIWNAVYLSGDEIPSVSDLQEMQPLSPDEAIKFKYGIRQVDFANFTYPVTGYWSWITKQVTLTNRKSPLYLVRNAAPYVNICTITIGCKSVTRYSKGVDSLRIDDSPMKVKYEDLTGDGVEEATVVLEAFYSHGTGVGIAMYWTYVYTMNGEQPLLLKYDKEMVHHFCF